MTDELFVAKVSVLDALGAFRGVLAKTDRFRRWSPDAKLELYQWLQGIEAAVLDSRDPDVVAQSGDYLGLFREVDALGIDDEGVLDTVAAKVDLAWEAWYKARPH